MLSIRSLAIFLCVLLALSVQAQKSTTLRCFSYQPLEIPSAQATEQFYGVIVNAPSGAKKLYNPFQYTSYPDYINIFDAKTNINVKYTDVKLSRPEFLAYLHACRCGLVDTSIVATKEYVNSQGFITLLALSATMPLTYNNTTGNFSTSINPNKLTGRYSPGGAGPLQEIDPGFGLDLTTGGVLRVDTNEVATMYDIDSIYAELFSAFNDSIQDVRQDIRDSISAGTGINYNSTTGVITNTAPDLTVTLAEGINVTITGTYPNFTINSTGGITSVDTDNTLTGDGSVGDPLKVDTTIIATQTYVNDTLANYLQVGDNVSELTNDAGYVDASGAASAAPIQSVTGTAVDNTDPENPVIDSPDLSDYLQIGDTLTLLATQYYVNDQGFITGVDWNQIGGTQSDIDLSGFSNNDNFLKEGDNVSDLNNDMGYLTANQTITLSGDVAGSGTTAITTTIANNAVTNAKFRQGAGLSVVGVTGNSTANVADIVASSDGILRRSGTSLSFGLIGVQYILGTSNYVPYASGGVMTESANLTFSGSVLNVTSVVNATTGYRVNGSAATGNYLRGNGTNFVSSALTSSDLSGAALSVLGRATNSSGALADISAGTDLHVLRRSGTSIGFGLLTGGSISATNNQLFYGVGGVAGQSANMTYDGTTATFISGFNSVSNITNGVNYTGTSTAVANTAYGVRYAQTLTANASINHSITGVQFSPTLVASSNFNFLYGAQLDPTFTVGAFTGVTTIPLQIIERSTTGQTIRIQNATAGATNGILLADNANGQRVSMYYIGATGQATYNLNGASSNIFNYSSVNLQIQNAFVTRATYFHNTGYYSHTPASSTATSGTGIAHNLTHSFAPTSGTGIHNWLQIDGVINQTGGANGITRGIYLNHTLTAAADYRAIEVANGKTKVRDIETGSADAIYLGDPNTDGTWRFIRSGNDLVTQRREGGVYVTKQTITP